MTPRDAVIHILKEQEGLTKPQIRNLLNEEQITTKGLSSVVKELYREGVLRIEADGDARRYYLTGQMLLKPEPVASQKPPHGSKPLSSPKVPPRISTDYQPYITKPSIEPLQLPIMPGPRFCAPAILAQLARWIAQESCTFDRLRTKCSHLYLSTDAQQLIDWLKLLVRLELCVFQNDRFVANPSLVTGAKPPIKSVILRQFRSKIRGFEELLNEAVKLGSGQITDLLRQAAEAFDSPTSNGPFLRSRLWWLTSFGLIETSGANFRFNDQRAYACGYDQTTEARPNEIVSPYWRGSNVDLTADLYSEETAPLPDLEHVTETILVNTESNNRARGAKKYRPTVSRPNLLQSHDPWFRVQELKPENVNIDHITDIDGVFSELLKRLRPREQTVILRRVAGETLQVIGTALDVTRERARQIEAKAVSKITEHAGRIFDSPSICACLDPDFVAETNPAPKSSRAKGARRSGLQVFAALILDADPKIWEAIGSGFDAVVADGKYKNQLLLASNHRRRIDGVSQLLININYHRIENWLGLTCRQLGQAGWYRNSRAPAEIQALITQTESIALPAHRLHAAIDDTMCQVSMPLSRLSLVGDYIMLSKTSRPTRAVRLHQILVALNRSAPIIELVTVHNRMYPDDRCKYRDVEIILREPAYHHLFMHLGEAFFISMSPSPTDLEKTKPGNIGAIYKEYISLLEVPRSQAGTIWNTSRKIGPATLSELAEHCQADDGSPLPMGSISAQVLTSGHFDRIAPSLWATVQHCSNIDSVNSYHPELLSRSHCENYIMARQAGEPQSWFCGWTPRMEYEWVKWGEKHLPKSIFCALLGVINTANWPVPEKEMKFWSARAYLDGNSTSIKPFYDGKVVDRIDRISWRALAAILILTKSGAKRISWLKVNRVLGARVRSTKSVTELAILVLAGALNGPIEWHQSHAKGANHRTVQKLVSDALNELGREAKVKWDSQYGIRLQALIRQTLQCPHHIGWVDGQVASSCAQVLGINTQQHKTSDVNQKKTKVLDDLQRAAARRRMLSK